MEPTADPGKDNAMAAVQRWRALLDTQMHFNSMIVQTRAIGMSVKRVAIGELMQLYSIPTRFGVESWSFRRNGTQTRSMLVPYAISTAP
jgi:hypothetical protein